MEQRVIERDRESDRVTVTESDIESERVTDRVIEGV